MTSRNTNSFLYQLRLAPKATIYENTNLYETYYRKCDSYEIVCYLTSYILTFTASLKCYETLLAIFRQYMTVARFFAKFHSGTFTGKNS